MHKFITPVSMECTQQQYRKDLKEPLEKLGYLALNFQELSPIFSVLATQYKNYYNYSNMNHSSKNNHGRYYIDHYNPELFLALAAMTEGDDWIKGEYLVKDGRIFKVKYLIGANSDLGKASNKYKEIYRKATKEEIISHFIKSKEKVFILPEKWCVKRNKFNDKIITDYFNSLGFFNHYYYERNSLCPYMSNVNGIASSKEIREGYTEITFKEFEEHVLKQKTMEKKLIGYKLTKLKYKDAVRNIVPDSLYLNDDSVYINVDSPPEIALREAGVLSLWFEPIHQEVFKQKEFTLRCLDKSLCPDTFSLTVSKEGFLYKPDNKYLKPEVIRNLISKKSEKYLIYSFTPIISHLDMGCKKMVPVEDIQPLLDYYQELMNS